MNTTIYTLKEFAEKLKVSTRTLVRWHENGKFTAKINPSGKMFYTEEDFTTYVGGESITLCEEDAIAIIDALGNDKPLTEEMLSRWKRACERYKRLIE